MGLCGVRQRKHVIDFKLQLSRLEPAKQIGSSRKDFIAAHRIMSERRTSEEQRSLCCKDSWIDWRHRTARLSIQHHVPTRPQAIETLSKRARTDGVVNDLDSSGNKSL